jgi:hypothetical protein
MRVRYTYVRQVYFRLTRSESGRFFEVVHSANIIFFLIYGFELVRTLNIE